ncbi:MAG: hypothetical protein WAW17_29480 [Rhodococcus sp. (in: high G+C Gram-positive bacteria)]|uniref:hypothetical protein n=1 Tax=Rhodococcus sp. TaxID=1831 RepID=UPI003BB0245B
MNLPPNPEATPTSDDIRKIVREEIDIRLETLQNLLEPAPEPVIPGLIRFAVDAFEVGSLAVAMLGALALSITKAAIR